MQNVNSLSDFIEKTVNHERVALFMYNPDHESSQCAFRNMTEAVHSNLSTSIFIADVKQVRDIHPVYNITSVPSLLLFLNGKLVNIVKGCHDSEYLKALMNNELSTSAHHKEEKKAIQITVYSTPTCSWCNTLKSWLKKNNITFRDIDVSRDEKAALDLVRRSGQQGVPQTEINGQIVVGFDQQRLKQLIGIQ